MLRRILDGTDQGGAVYALFNRCALYIGKAVCLRKNGAAGPTARLMEHHRAYRIPEGPEGQKPRYRILRGMGLAALRWLPLIMFPTEQQTLAAERVAIAMEQNEFYGCT